MSTTRSMEEQSIAEIVGRHIDGISCDRDLKLRYNEVREALVREITLLFANDRVDVNRLIGALTRQLSALMSSLIPPIVLEQVDPWSLMGMLAAESEAAARFLVTSANQQFDADTLGMLATNCEN